MTCNNNVLKTKVSGSVWVGMHSAFSRRYTRMKLLPYFSFCSSPFHRVIFFYYLALGCHHYWKHYWVTLVKMKIASRFVKGRPEGVLSTSSKSQFCWSNSLLTHKMYHTPVITHPQLQVSLSWFTALPGILWLSFQGHWCINSFFGPEFPRSSLLFT